MHYTLHETHFLKDVYDIAHAANSEQQWQQFYIINFISFILYNLLLFQIPTIISL